MRVGYYLWGTVVEKSTEEAAVSLQLWLERINNKCAEISRHKNQIKGCFELQV